MVRYALKTANAIDGVIDEEVELRKRRSVDIDVNMKESDRIELKRMELEMKKEIRKFKK